MFIKFPRSRRQRPVIFSAAILLGAILLVLPSPSLAGGGFVIGTFEDQYLGRTGTRTTSSRPTGSPRADSL